MAACSDVRGRPTPLCLQGRCGYHHHSYHYHHTTTTATNTTTTTTATNTVNTTQASQNHNPPPPARRVSFFCGACSLVVASRSSPTQPAQPSSVGGELEAFVRRPAERRPGRGRVSLRSAVEKRPEPRGLFNALSKDGIMSTVLVGEHSRRGKAWGDLSGNRSAAVHICAEGRILR